MTKLFHTHSTFAEGGMDFGKWLATIPSVAYVNAGNLRNSHIASGKRDPTVQATKTSAIVTYYAGGSAQRFFVFPASRIHVESLTKRVRSYIRNRWLKEDKLGGNIGESSKAEIKIPESVRKESEMAEHVNDIAFSDTVVLSPVQVEAYELLLSLGPKDANINQFIVERLEGILRTKFDRPTARVIGATLRRKGLIKAGNPIAGSPNSKEWYVFKRPYITKNTNTKNNRNYISTITSVAKETKKEVIVTPPKTQDDPILDKVKVIEFKCLELQKLGFSIEIIFNKVSLHRSSYGDK